MVCGCAGIGRLASLRCLCPDGRTGSTPVSRTKKERHDLGRVFLFLLSVAGVGLSFIWFEDPALGRDPFLSQSIWKIFEME